MTRLRIDPNFAINAFRTHQTAMNRSLERLATGKRINRASDDPSGMIRAEELMFDIRKLEKNIESGDLGAHFVGAADGALSVVGEMLIELKGLVVTAANRGAMSAREREALQVQADSILDGISTVTHTTVFKGERVLAEGFGVKVGSHGISMGMISLTGMGVVSPEPDPDTPGATPPGDPGATFNIANLRTGGALNLVSGDLEMAGQSVEAAINEIATQRATIGSQLQGVESDMNVWRSELQELVGAHSDLVDLDYAKETSELIRTQLMRDAAISAVLISRENAERTLDLLVQSAESIDSEAPTGLGLDL